MTATSFCYEIPKPVPLPCGLHEMVDEMSLAGYRVDGEYHRERREYLCAAQDGVNHILGIGKTGPAAIVSCWRQWRKTVVALERAWMEPSW